MKVCPVCNESFGDELNFCDVDGTRLTREGPSQRAARLWPLLGAGLVIGGLVISVISIFFLPKRHATTLAPSTSTQPASVSSQAPAAPPQETPPASPTDVAAAKVPESEAITPEETAAL